MRAVQTLTFSAVFMMAAALPGAQRALAGEADTGMASARDNYQTFCAKCHGENGKGNGAAAATLNPKPRDYTDCKSMENRSDSELFKVVSEGGASIGMSADMQAWGGTLSDEEIHGLVTYVRSFCKQPAAGGAEQK
jgi:cytochrome c oxidase cbb3-type subunit III